MALKVSSSRITLVVSSKDQKTPRNLLRAGERAKNGGQHRLKDVASMMAFEDTRCFTDSRIKKKKKNIPTIIVKYAIQSCKVFLLFATTWRPAGSRSELVQMRFKTRSLTIEAGPL